MTEKQKEEIQAIIDEGLSGEECSLELESLRASIFHTCMRQWPELIKAAKRASVDMDIAWESYKDTIKRAFSIGLPKE